MLRQLRQRCLPVSRRQLGGHGRLIASNPATGKAKPAAVTTSCREIPPQGAYIPRRSITSAFTSLFCQPTCCFTSRGRTKVRDASRLKYPTCALNTGLLRKIRRPRRPSPRQARSPGDAAARSTGAPRHHLLPRRHPSVDRSARGGGALTRWSAGPAPFISSRTPVPSVPTRIARAHQKGRPRPPHAIQLQ